MPSFRRKETAAYPFSKRILKHLKRKAGILPKRMDISFVKLGSQRYKRISFIDNYTPIRLKATLDLVSSSNHFPKLLIQHENELWVEYLDGHLLNIMSDPICDQLAKLYGDLSSINPTKITAGNYVNEIEINLDFLRKMDVIDYQLQQKLLSLLTRIAPKEVWVGLDYADAIPSNFLIQKDSHKLVAIDIESLKEEALLGRGLAKAATIWLDDIYLRRIINYLKENKHPDFYNDMEFINLYFRSEWLKSLFLRNKRKRLANNRHILLQLV